MSDERATSGSSQKGKLLLVIVLIAVAIGVWSINAGERSARTEYNRIIQNLMNQGEYEAAYEQLMSLVEAGETGTIEADIRSAAARSALAAAEREDADVETTRLWLQRTHELDPTLLNDLQRRLVAPPPAE
ncbi:hypothetical protein [Mucisphaera sp.]|uniref:hypothetical protein n=1 Tax=Mucisphaera sp. TaxID=2913024 RepID=UPI003D112E99